MLKIFGAAGAALFLQALVAAGIGRAEAGPTAIATVGPIPLRDLFRPPYLDLPLVNDAGDKLISLVQTEDDHTAAVLIDLEKGSQQGIRGPSDRDIYELNWLDDRHFLMSQSHEKLYADGLFVVNVKAPDKTFAVERHSAVEIIGVPRRSPMQPIVWIRQDAYKDLQDGGAVRIDAQRPVDQQRDLNPVLREMMRKEDAIARNGTAASIKYSYDRLPSGMTESYLADRDGELAFAVTIDKGVEHLFHLRDGHWVASPLDLDTYHIMGTGDAAGELLAIGPRQEGKPRALLRVDAISGQPTGVLYQDQNYDPIVERVLRDPASRNVIGVQLYRVGLETVWFDEPHKLLQARLNAAFPQRMVAIIGSDLAEQRVVLSVTSDRRPAEYYLMDLAKNRATLVASSAPWIKPEQALPMQMLRYKSRDGHRLEGFFTLPHGASKAAPPPLVVLVHGGPWVRDAWEWNPEVQFLATRGYAVFQPNYRGSSGYNWSFEPGDNWDFQKMHFDVTDGVKKILASGLADSKRVAIMGASFGGYLAMCGAAYEPGLYRCAITEAGVFDWTLMMRSARQDQFESTRYQWYLRNLGDPKKESDRFAAISPLNHVDQVTIPVFVAHGKDDNVVSIEQSRRLISELKKRNLPHRVLFKGGEGHGMFRLDNRLQYYQAVEDFLGENMKSL
jgi:fermentation-respiration switch protein FrsA (DUF1100 family)